MPTSSLTGATGPLLSQRYASITSQAVKGRIIARLPDRSTDHGPGGRVPSPRQMLRANLRGPAGYTPFLEGGSPLNVKWARMKRRS